MTNANDEGVTEFVEQIHEAREEPEGPEPPDSQTPRTVHLFKKNPAISVKSHARMFADKRTAGLENGLFTVPKPPTQVHDRTPNRLSLEKRKKLLAKKLAAK